MLVTTNVAFVEYLSGHHHFKKSPILWICFV